jgi:hypothetical protein
LLFHSPSLVLLSYHVPRRHVAVIISFKLNHPRTMLQCGIIGLPLFITAVAARSATSRGGGSVTRAKLPAEGGRPPGAGGGLDVIWEWRTAACGWPATGQT